MRDPLLVLGRPLAPELTAERAGRCQFRGEPALNHPTTLRDRHLPK